MLDDTTKSSGLANLATIPAAFNTVFNDLAAGNIHFAAVLGLITIVTIIIWNLVKDRISFTKVFPAPLIAVLTASVLVSLYHFPVKMIQIPSNLLEGLTLSNFTGSFSVFSFSFFIKAVGIAFVASAETLLCVTAVDKLVKKGESNYNKELMAQGFGNFVAGLFGALPITGVIVRSSANIEAGGRTRMAAILHGVWLVALVLFFPFILNMIPMSALAAILVFTGWRLFDAKSIPGIYKKSKGEFAIYATTITTIVAVDLLTGVIAGFIVSLFILVMGLLDFEFHHEDEGGVHHLHIKGRLSFLCIPKLVNQLNNFKPEHNDIVVNLENIEYMDHAIDEHIEHWKESMEHKGQKVRIIA
jgi:MFS superfamily sulfate permease-like transporter